MSIKNEVIIKEYLGNGIEFKLIDDLVYVNATSIAKAFENGSQKLADWKRSKKTQELIEVLNEVNKINDMENFHNEIIELIISEKGGNDGGGATWIYEKLVLDFCRYLSIAFSIWCDKQIFTLLREGLVSLVTKTEEDMILELFPNTDMALVTMTANTIRQNKALVIELKEEKEYISHIVHNERYYITPTTMANKYGMSAVKFNKILQDLNVQYKKGKKWCLKADYYGIGDYAYFEKPNGEWEKGSSLRYSNDGERVLYKILTANGHEPVRDIL